jgi:hypothetical protein
MVPLFQTWVRRAISRIDIALILFLLVCTIVAGGGARAWADPLVIQSGYFGRSGGDPAAFYLVGEGLTVGGILFRGGEDFGPYRTCAYQSPCNVGDMIDFSSSFTGPAFPSGPITFGGQLVTTPPEYPNFVLLADFRIAGPTVAVPPIGSDDTARLTEAFTFSGSLIGHAAQGSYEGYVLGPQLFATSLFGRGHADLVLVPRPTCPNFDCAPAPPFHVGLLDYRFEPVPEPGTLVLFGIGSGAMALARAARRRRTH